MKKLVNIARKSTLVVTLFSCTSVLLLWEMAVRIFHIEKYILPKPTDIFREFFVIKDILPEHIIQTLTEALMGLAVAIVIALVIAIIMDLSPFMYTLFHPLLVISQTIPTIAVAPLFVMWFGYGILPKVIVVVLVCFFPIAVNVVEGFRSVDREMLRLMESMNATKWQVYRMVKIPATMPSFFSGLKIAATYSVTGAVVGEWLGANQGLGILLTRSAKSFSTERVFVTVFTIVLLSLAIYFIVEMVARLVMPWFYKLHKKG